MLEATYNRQFLLTVENETGSHRSWYDENSSVLLVAQEATPFAGLLGSLGAMNRLQGWYENGSIVVSSNGGLIIMNRPHHLIMVRKADYSLPVVEAIFIILLYRS
jgi:hypothetical protein